MIPEAAVEAAAKAAYIHHSNEPGFDAAAAWDDMGGTEDWEREQWESEARAALEAAAPHMLSVLRAELADLAQDFDAAVGGTLVYTAAYGRHQLRKNAHDQLMYIVENYMDEAK